MFNIHGNGKNIIQFHLKNSNVFFCVCENTCLCWYFSLLGPIFWFVEKRILNSFSEFHFGNTLKLEFGMHYSDACSMILFHLSVFIQCVLFILQRDCHVFQYILLLKCLNDTAPMRYTNWNSILLRWFSRVNNTKIAWMTPSINQISRTLEFSIVKDLRLVVAAFSGVAWSRIYLLQWYEPRHWMYEMQLGVHIFNTNDADLVIQ